MLNSCGEVYAVLLALTLLSITFQNIIILTAERVKYCSCYNPRLDLGPVYTVLNMVSVRAYNLILF